MALTRDGAADKDYNIQRAILIMDPTKLTIEYYYYASGGVTTSKEKNIWIWNGTYFEMNVTINVMITVLINEDFMLLLLT